MNKIDKIKLPKDITKLAIFVKNEDGTPYGMAILPKRNWRKQFTAFFDGLVKTNKLMTVYLMDLDDNNACKSVLFEESINKKEEIPIINLK